MIKTNAITQPTFYCYVEGDSTHSQNMVKNNLLLFITELVALLRGNDGRDGELSVDIFLYNFLNWNTFELCAGSFQHVAGAPHHHHHILMFYS